MPPTLLLPRTLGNWRLERSIGEGAFGTVYEAEHVTITKRRAAVKVLHEHAAQRPGIKQRFLNEASAAGRAEHQNIVQIFDGGIAEDGTCYSVMELLKGRPLTELLAEGRLSAHRAVAIAVQIAGALQAAHELQIVHRDLKPDNIFIVARPAVPEFVKVLDFGVAKLRDEGATATQAGVRIGTPRYMSPEQWMAEADVDGRADIYALGVLLFECLTGHAPYRANEQCVLANAHLNMPIPDLDGELDVPLALNDFIRRMLAKDRKDRPASMARVVEFLQEMEPTQPSRPRALVRPPLLAGSSPWDEPTNVDRTTRRIAKVTVETPAAPQRLPSTEKLTTLGGAAIELPLLPPPPPPRARRGLPALASSIGVIASVVIAALVLSRHHAAIAPPAPSPSASSTVSAPDPAAPAIAPADTGGNERKNLEPTMVSTIDAPASPDDPGDAVSAAAAAAAKAERTNAAKGSSHATHGRSAHAAAPSVSAPPVVEEPVPPPPPSHDEIEEMINHSMNEYVSGHYPAAIRIALGALNEADASQQTRVWRVLGASACYQRDRNGARTAWQRLDTADRVFIGYICSRNDIALP